MEYGKARIWDDDHSEWDAPEHAYAAAWRNQPKWMVSRSLTSVGPSTLRYCANATAVHVYFGT
jgi:hypothetical protein